MSEDESEVPNQHAAVGKSPESEDNDVRRREWLSKITLGDLVEKTGANLLHFDFDSYRPSPTIAVPISVLVELQELRRQVAEFQARGTEQVSLARACAFEAAAKECEGIVSQYPHNEQIQKYMPVCAFAIRTLAKR